MNIRDPYDGITRLHREAYNRACFVKFNLDVEELVVPPTQGFSGSVVDIFQVAFLEYLCGCPPNVSRHLTRAEYIRILHQSARDMGYTVTEMSHD